MQHFLAQTTTNAYPTTPGNDEWGFWVWAIIYLIAVLAFVGLFLIRHIGWQLTCMISAVVSIGLQIYGASVLDEAPMLVWALVVVQVILLATAGLLMLKTTIWAPGEPYLDQYTDVKS